MVTSPSRRAARSHDDHAAQDLPAGHSAESLLDVADTDRLTDKPVQVQPALADVYKRQSPYGLTAAVFTRDLARGLAFAERAEVGWVNICLLYTSRCV